MWLCSSDSFVSVVEDWQDNRYVFVRARDKNHLLNFFENYDVEIVETPSADYQYRVRMLKVVLSKLVAIKILGVDYTNFKDSVPIDMNDLSRFYTEVWVSGVNNLDSRPFEEFWKDIRDNEVKVKKN